MISTLEKFGSGMHYFRVSKKGLGELSAEKRLLCTINAGKAFHCALMPKKEGGYYVNVGSKIIKNLRLKVGDSIQVEFEKDTSTFQFDCPEELKEVLGIDIEAKDIFDSLTDGNKRGLIYLVNQVKSVDKRIERSLTIATKLKSGIISPKHMLKK